MMQPFRLRPWFSPRVWGWDDISAWYPEYEQTERIGEAWLTGDESVVASGEHAGKTLGALVREYPDELSCGEGDFALLLKVLFPLEKLSVQVHPDDEQARAKGATRGKTECWYVLEAEPGAAVSLGLKEGVTVDAVRAGIADGTMEELVERVPVSAGDMVFVDAGTVHAIEPGVVILETQETSDVTYRMFDYGRGRELHVDDALEVMRLKTAAGKVPPVRHGRALRLIECPIFAVDRFEVDGMMEPRAHLGVPHCIVGIEGKARVEGEGFAPVEILRGEATVIPAGVSGYRVVSEGAFVGICAAPPARLG